jgi:2-hydroxy-6-oxonona-2,4-dienedioate hydrolase
LSSTRPIPTEAQALAFIEGLESRGERMDVPFEGATMRWHRFGAGTPLVLVHGGNGSWLHWVRNIEALSAAHELWLPDLPGCGDSATLPPPATLERLVAALQHGIDTLVGTGRDIGIAAFSFGSVLSSTLAVTRGHVRRLALLGATGHGLPRRPLALQNWRTLPEADQDGAHRHNLAALMLHEPAAVDALALVVHRSASRRTQLRSKPLSHTTATRDALDRLSIPILLAWGEHDPTAAGPDTAQRVAGGRPERQALVLPGAGHWLQYERADEVNALLAQWFT